MANTYTLISSNVLASSAASVTFSAIPSTYTDLVIRTSLRSAEVATTTLSYVEFNDQTLDPISQTNLLGNGSTASSSRVSDTTNVRYRIPGASATSNTFSNFELYLPSYASSNNKPYSIFNTAETNATTITDGIAAIAALRRKTSAVTTITFYNQNDENFVSGSSFYLYGIKNS